jgi:hypothetical protein
LSKESYHLETLLKESVNGAEMNLLLVEHEGSLEIMFEKQVFGPQDLIEKWHRSIDKQRFLIRNRL